ncbi:hypothetical protein ACHAW5_000153 [Stephanodiscus triporus]|uniref:Vacuolar protein 8 n=1 Tax=Stephanodiscus triporus TaxID=2934178 RepID=A0ABD3PCG6_9STRA
MDILFPWRRVTPPPRTTTNAGVGGQGGSFGIGGGGNLGGSGTSGSSGGASGPHHSLPHPQEHAAHYGGGAGVGGRFRGGARRGVVGGGGGGDGDGGGGPPPPQSAGGYYLDESYRSVESELSDRTGAWAGGAQAAPGGGGGNDGRSSGLPPPQSRRGGGGEEYHDERLVGVGAAAAAAAPRGRRQQFQQQWQQQRRRGSGRSSRGGRAAAQQQRQSARSVDRSHRWSGTQSLGEMYAEDNAGMMMMMTGTGTGGEEEEECLPVSPLRQLLDAINMSILPTSLRLSSLAQAVEFFDHRDRAMHDAELREGGAFVLYHKLGLVLRLSKSGEAALSAGIGGGGGSMDNNSNANGKRGGAGAGAGGGSGNGNGGAEILPLLVHVLERPFQKIERAVWTALQEKANVPGSLERAVAMAVTRDQKLAVQKATKVLAMYSLVPEAKRPMCECEGMLRWLTRIIDTHNYNRVRPGAPVVGGTASTSSSGGGMGGGPGGATGSSGQAGTDGEESDDKRRAKRLELATRATSGAGLYMTEAARFNTIATLTNLAAHEANRMPMLREPGLLDNICRVVHNERSDVPKQCSALAIMNLSNGDMDHVPEMARNDLVLETLLKLMKEDNPETRRNAVVTIFNVACSDQNTVRLARYRDGTVLESLVELVGSDDPVLRGHDEARANAAETLFNMACSEISETTDRMANHAGLLECLAVTLRGEHTGLEVKMYCSATLRRMAEIIRHPMIAQGALLSALVKAATWTNTDCIAEAFRAQASVPENCVIMAQHHGLLNALSRLALTRGEGEDTEKVRMASCLAIELMSRQDEARALLSQNEGIIMALTKASYGEDQQEFDHRMSKISEMNGSVTDYQDASRRISEGDGDDEVSDDDMSLQSRRIQLALKNLVAAM